MRKLILLLAVIFFASMASAQWTDNFDVGLQRYFKLDETSGDFAIDEIKGLNLTHPDVVLGKDGIIGTSYGSRKTTNIGGWVNGTVDMGVGVGEDFTVSVWVNETTFTIGGVPTAYAFGFGQTDPAFAMSREGAGGGTTWIFWNAWRDMQVNVTGNLGVWMHIVLTRNASVINCYINATICPGSFSVSEELQTKFHVSSDRGSNKNEGINGTFDEVALWNRTLSSDEIFDLYNDGLGITFPVGSVNITLDAPPNNFTSTTGDFNFEATATVTDSTLVNMSLFHNLTGTFVLNQTEALTGTLNSSNISLSFPDATTVGWKFQACIATGTCTFSDEERIVNVDFPDFLDVTIVFPENITYFVNISDLNYTLTGDLFDLDSCKFTIDGGIINTSIVCGVNATIPVSDGSHTWTVFANETNGNETSDTVAFSIDTSIPIVNIIFPVNGTNYDFNVTGIQYSASSPNPGVCFFSLDSGVTNSSTVAYGINFTEPNATEVANLWTVYCDDTVGKVGFDIVSFNAFVAVNHEFNVTITSGANFNFFANGSVSTVTPPGQNDTLGVLTANNDLTFIIDVVANVDSSETGITFRLGNSSVFANSIVINESFQVIWSDIGIGNTEQIWGWAVFDNATTSYFPSLEVVARVGNL